MSSVKSCPATDEELPVFVRFVMGRIFPDWSSRKLGIGPNLLTRQPPRLPGFPGRM